jgi:hypothetical protein
MANSGVLSLKVEDCVATPTNAWFVPMAVDNRIISISDYITACRYVGI